MSVYLAEDVADELDAMGMTEYAEIVRAEISRPSRITLNLDELTALRDGRACVYRDNVYVYFD